MDENQEIINLRKENEYLKNELQTQKYNYKSLSSELGQSIFKCEDLDQENRKLKRKIDDQKEELNELKEELNELKKFKEKVESSTSWKIKSMFK